MNILRFAALVAIMIWLGSLITLSFQVAPSLFSNESGVVPNSSVAGDIIGPMLRRMHLTSEIAIAIVMILLGVMSALSGGAKTQRLRRFCFALLAIALLADAFSFSWLTLQIESIRAQLKADFGGYHLAPPDDPRRAKFGMLHGMTMMIAMLDLLLGLAAFYCISILPGASPRETTPTTNKEN